MLIRERGNRSKIVCLLACLTNHVERISDFISRWSNYRQLLWLVHNYISRSPALWLHNSECGSQLQYIGLKTYDRLCGFSMLWNVLWLKKQWKTNEHKLPSKSKWPAELGVITLFCWACNICRNSLQTYVHVIKYTLRDLNWMYQ